MTLNLDCFYCNALSFSRLRRQLPHGGSLWHKNILLLHFVCFLSPAIASSPPRDYRVVFFLQKADTGQGTKPISSYPMSAFIILLCDSKSIVTLGICCAVIGKGRARCRAEAYSVLIERNRIQNLRNSLSVKLNNNVRSRC